MKKDERIGKHGAFTAEELGIDTESCIKPEDVSYAEFMPDAELKEFQKMIDMTLEEKEEYIKQHIELGIDKEDIF